MATAGTADRRPLWEQAREQTVCKAYPHFRGKNTINLACFSFYCLLFISSLAYSAFSDHSLPAVLYTTVQDHILSCH